MAGSHNHRGATSRRAVGVPARRRLADYLRRSARALTMMSSMAAIGWGGWSLYQALDVPVTVVRVEGEFLYSMREQVAGLVEPQIRRGFLGLDLDEIRRVLERDPWIERAEVRREWPDTLHIAITEEMPIARWGSNGFLNRRGEPLRIEDSRGLDDLPLLQGGNGDARRVMAQYRDVSQLLRPLGLRVSEFHYQPRGSSSLVLQKGVTVYFGRGQVLEKVQRFITVYRKALRERFGEIESVDARYVNGVAVRWKTVAS